MAVFGVVCEFNPLHTGHKYLLDRARAMGAEAVVCVMSGNACQRGELAVADKYIRGKAAVLSGADLVLELPYPWSSASAEYFARAAVGVLSGLCDTLIFGSECGDIELLTRTAALADSESFREEYRERLERGEGSAEAYFSMLSACSGASFSSNDLLGIEYIRAIRRGGYSMTPIAIPRVGMGYRDTDIREGELPSASALRKVLRCGSVERWEGYVPPRAFEVYRVAEAEGCITDPSRLDGAALGFFRMKRGEELEGIAEAGGGLGERICATAMSATSLEELISLSATKRYTTAKVRRAILFSMTGVTDDLLRSEAEYTLLLAANEKGRAILSEARRKGGIPIVTKGADAPEGAQRDASWRLDALFTLGSKNRREGFAMLKKSPYMEGVSKKL